MKVKIVSAFCFLFLFSGALKAQEKVQYPDSLKGVVLKFEPLSFLYDHLSAGVEVPVGRTFLDVNIGASGLGFNNYQDRKGGFLTKVGIKIPLKLNSPFSLLYVMPEVAYSAYKKFDYNPPSYGNEIQKVNATAILFCFGYRHLSPSSNFYYDGGIDLGYGWANLGSAYNNYNFNISRYDQYYTQRNISGAALSCHFAIGILIKPKSAN
jgi:hypothetical protein